MPGWDETIGVVAGSAGVLIIDTGATLRDGADLRRSIRGVLGRDVTHVALTHPHFDHVMGTAAFSGVQVFGAAAWTNCSGASRTGCGGTRSGTVSIRWPPRRPPTSW